MLAMDYMLKGDADGAAESLNNIAISRKDAQPSFDAFSRYRLNQKLWEQIGSIVAQKRYQMRKVMEKHNLSNQPILRNEQSERQLSQAEIGEVLKKAFDFEISDADWKWLSESFRVNTYYEDELLFRSGDYNNTMYVLLKGELVLFSGARNTGGEIEIARLRKGDVLGESCMTNQMFTLNCRAVQFTELVCIDKEEIRKLVETRPELGVKFFQQVLMKVVGKMRNNNMYSLSMGGGAVLDSFIEGSESETE